MKGFEKDFGASAEFLKKKGFDCAQIGIILGTGLARAAGIIANESKADFAGVPGLPGSRVGFQSPSFVTGMVGGKKVVATDGRFHFYEGHSMREVASVVYIMHRLGVKRIYVTSAVGGINEEYRAGDLVLVTDHINLSAESPLVGLRDAKGNIIFPNMLDAYDTGKISRLKEVAREKSVTLKEGVLAYLPGPSFETRAELRFLKSAGADLIGWSMVPEVMLAKALGMAVTGICCVSDISDPAAASPADLEEIVRVCREASNDLAAILKWDIEGV